MHQYTSEAVSLFKVSIEVYTRHVRGPYLDEETAVFTKEMMLPISLVAIALLHQQESSDGSVARSPMPVVFNILGDVRPIEQVEYRASGPPILHLHPIEGRSMLPYDDISFRENACNKLQPEGWQLEEPETEKA